jgi:hypothetical protein
MYRLNSRRNSKKPKVSKDRFKIFFNESLIKGRLSSIGFGIINFICVDSKNEEDETSLFKRTAYFAQSEN